jgi:D-alanine-D-alanine ligase
MKSNSKILICYNSPVSLYKVYDGKSKSSSSEDHDLSESGFSKEIKLIEAALSKYHSTVESFAVDGNVNKVIEKIYSYSPDVIFNFVESVEGVSSFEAYMAGVFELLQVEYTGSTPQCLGNCLNKSRTKQILNYFGINTPKYHIYKAKSRLTQKSFSLNFPVITKLLKEDASIGISENSVVNNFDELKKQLKFLSSAYNQDVIIEEYIEGREFNVAILGGKVLPISEIDFKGLPNELPKIVTYEGKWISESVYYKYTTPKCPAELAVKLKSLIEETAITAFDALGCRDYARVDIRVDKNNVPYIIEVNPNPDISTDSGFQRAAAAQGMNYEKLLFTISDFALQRVKRGTQVRAA